MPSSAVLNQKTLLFWSAIALIFTSWFKPLKESCWSKHSIKQQKDSVLTLEACGLLSIQLQKRTAADLHINRELFHEVAKVGAPTSFPSQQGRLFFHACGFLPLWPGPVVLISASQVLALTREHVLVHSTPSLLPRMQFVQNFNYKLFLPSSTSFFSHSSIFFLVCHIIFIWKTYILPTMLSEGWWSFTNERSLSRAICPIYMGQPSQGLVEMEFAAGRETAWNWFKI